MELDQNCWGTPAIAAHHATERTMAMIRPHSVFGSMLCALGRHDDWRTHETYFAHGITHWVQVCSRCGNLKWSLVK